MIQLQQKYARVIKSERTNLQVIALIVGQN